MDDLGYVYVAVQSYDHNHIDDVSVFFCWRGYDTQSSLLPGMMRSAVFACHYVPQVGGVCITSDKVIVARDHSCPPSLTATTVAHGQTVQTLTAVTAWSAAGLSFVAVGSADGKIAVFFNSSLGSAETISPKWERVYGSESFLVDSLFVDTVQMDSVAGAPFGGQSGVETVGMLIVVRTAKKNFDHAYLVRF